MANANEVNVVEELDVMSLANEAIILNSKIAEMSKRLDSMKDTLREYAGTVKTEDITVSILADLGEIQVTFKGEVATLSAANATKLPALRDEIEEDVFNTFFKEVTSYKLVVSAADMEKQLKKVPAMDRKLISKLVKVAAPTPSIKIPILKTT